MKDSEKRIEASLRDHIKKMGGLCIKLTALHFTGLPDRLCLLPGGRLFFAELKTTGEKPTKIQSTVHTRLQKLDFKVFIIDSIENLKSVLKSYE